MAPPLQYSCLENPMDGGAWKVAVHGVTEGRTHRDYITMYAAWGQFLLLENLLTNPVILKCILWD